MPREVEIEFTAPEEVTGVAPGTKRLVFGVDADEFCAKKMAIITNEFPPPRSWLLDEYGNFPIGVRSSSQAKMSEQQRADEQTFLQAQVKNLDAQHEQEQEERKRKDALATRRKAVAHE